MNNYPQLAIQYNGYDLPKELEQIYKAGIGQKMIGSKSFAKLTSFLNEQQLTNNINDVMDFYVRIKPERQENESYPEYKARQKFQQVLLKYRKYLYNHDAGEITLKAE